MLNRAGLTDLVNVVGKIIIEDNVFVGSNSIIMPGVRIQKNSIVASGSVVTKDVQQGSIVAGVPAKKIGTIDSYLKKYDQEHVVIQREEHIKTELQKWMAKEDNSEMKIGLRLKNGKTKLTK